MYKKKITAHVSQRSQVILKCNYEFYEYKK